jgi:hypothetical protein
MKQEKFINVLKKVINEEVRSVIKQELTEILKSGLQSTVNELQETKQEVIKHPIEKTISNNNLKFKKNKFSDILNETNKLTETKSSSDYASLMSEDIVMTSKDAQGFNFNRQSVSNSTINDPETGKTMKVDPVVAKAMTRDYSALMKAIDKKKGNGVPA